MTIKLTLKAIDEITKLANEKLDEIGKDWSVATREGMRVKPGQVRAVLEAAQELEKITSRLVVL